MTIQSVPCDPGSIVSRRSGTVDGSAAPSLVPSLQPEELAEFPSLAQRVADGEVELEVLRKAGSLTGRLRLASGATVIVKLWSRTGVRGALRKQTRTNPAMREWRVLRKLERLGVRAPRVLKICYLRRGGAQYTEAIFIEDLGRTVEGLEHLKSLIQSGQPEAAAVYEEYLIRTTETMIRAGVLDPDHRMTNFVVTADGTPVRLDFELARLVFHVGLHPDLVGQMIGTLVATYCYAVQPDSGRAADFAARLAARIGPSRRALKGAGRLVREKLEKQRLETGIDMRIDLPW